MSAKPKFEPRDFADIIHDPAQPLIVGGQAVNIWAEAFHQQSQRLQELTPFVSEDGDIIGDENLARKLAIAHNWELQINPDFRNPIAAILLKNTPKGELQIDVLRRILGTSPKELITPNFVTTPSNLCARVPIPAILLKAKLRNLYELDNKKQDGSARNDNRHVVMLVLICNQYIKNMARAVLEQKCPERALINELHLLDEIIHSPEARHVQQRFNIDVVPALPLDLNYDYLPKIQRFYEYRTRTTPSAPETMEPDTQDPGHSGPDMSAP